MLIFVAAASEDQTEKWNQHIPSVPGGRKFSMRFLNSAKIECTIDKATPKVHVLELVLSVG